MDIKTEPVDYYEHEPDGDYSDNTVNRVQSKIRTETLFTKQATENITRRYEFQSVHIKTEKDPETDQHSLEFHQCSSRVDSMPIEREETGPSVRIKAEPLDLHENNPLPLENEKQLRCTRFSAPSETGCISQIAPAKQIKNEIVYPHESDMESEPAYIISKEQLNALSNLEHNSQISILPDIEMSSENYNSDTTNSQDNFPSSKNQYDDDFSGPSSSGCDSQSSSVKTKAKFGRGKLGRQKKAPKSSAERQKEYRERVKVTKCVSKPTINQPSTSAKHASQANIEAEIVLKTEPGVDSTNDKKIQVAGLQTKSNSQEVCNSVLPTSNNGVTQPEISRKRTTPMNLRTKNLVQQYSKVADPINMEMTSNSENEITIEVPKKPKKVYYYAKRFKCDMCSHECRHLSHLITHKMIHSGEKPYKCDMCRFECRQVSDLKKHKAIHGDEKPFKCEVCPYASTQAAYLRRHKLKHTTEKPFKCDICPVECKQLSDLKNHKMIHSDEKPFKCDQCPFECRKLIYLKNHKMTHTDEKPFKCDMCQFESRQLNILKSHQKIHSAETPFKCDKCPFQCKRATHLKNHKMIHTGEKPFKCHICPFECRQSGNLKRHKATHTIETLEVTFCPSDNQQDSSSSSASVLQSSVKVEVNDTEIKAAREKNTINAVHEKASANATPVLLSSIKVEKIDDDPKPAMSELINASPILLSSIKVEPNTDEPNLTVLNEILNDTPSLMPSIKEERLDDEEVYDHEMINTDTSYFPTNTLETSPILLPSVRVKIEPSDSEF